MLNWGKTLQCVFAMWRKKKPQQPQFLDLKLHSIHILLFQINNLKQQQQHKNAYMSCCVCDELCWQRALLRPTLPSPKLTDSILLPPPSPPSKSQTVLWNIGSLCCVRHRWYLHLITQRAFLFLHLWDLWHMIGCWLFSLVSFADKIKLAMTWFMGVILHSRPVSGGSRRAPCVSVCACVWQEKEAVPNLLYRIWWEWRQKKKRWRKQETGA